MVISTDVVDSSHEYQLALFEAGAELLTVDEDAKRGRFSGKIIEKNRAKVEAICGALAEGHGILRIARAFEVSAHTVMGIRDRHPELIAIEEKALSRRYSRILSLSAERYEEALISGAIPAAQIPVGAGIFFDKKSLIDGRPTAIVEHRRVEVGYEAINELLEALPRAVVELPELPATEKESDDLRADS